MPITVRELKRLCEVAIEQGHGDKVVQISEDEEGNGFHTLFYGFDLNQECMGYALDNDLIHDNRGERMYDQSNAIILG